MLSEVNTFVAFIKEKGELEKIKELGRKTD